MTAVFLITLFGVVLWKVNQWDKKRLQEMAKREEYPFDESDNYL